MGVPEGVRTAPKGAGGSQGTAMHLSRRGQRGEIPVSLTQVFILLCAHSFPFPCGFGLERVRLQSRLFRAVIQGVFEDSLILSVGA